MSGLGPVLAVSTMLSVLHLLLRCGTALLGPTWRPSGLSSESASNRGGGRPGHREPGPRRGPALPDDAPDRHPGQRTPGSCAGRQRLCLAHSWRQLGPIQLRTGPCSSRAELLWSLLPLVASRSPGIRSGGHRGLAAAALGPRAWLDRRAVHPQCRPPAAAAQLSQRLRARRLYRGVPGCLGAKHSLLVGAGQLLVGALSLHRCRCTMPRGRSTVRRLVFESGPTVGPVPVSITCRPLSVGRRCTDRRSYVIARGAVR